MSKAEGIAQRIAEAVRRFDPYIEMTVPEIVEVVVTELAAGNTFNVTYGLREMADPYLDSEEAQVLVALADEVGREF